MRKPEAVAKEFRDFLLKQNVFALAIAVVVGTALNGLVKSIVDGLIMPIVAVVTPSGDWEKSTWSLGPFHFSVGSVFAALLNFVVIGFVAWRISKLLIKPEPAKPPTKTCDYCRSTIDVLATRCPQCTSALTAITEPKPAAAQQLPA